jgi:hypothetical protein
VGYQLLSELEAHVFPHLSRERSAKAVRLLSIMANRCRDEGTERNPAATYTQSPRTLAAWFHGASPDDVTPSQVDEVSRALRDLERADVLTRVRHRGRPAYLLDRDRWPHLGWGWGSVDNPPG